MTAHGGRYAIEVDRPPGGENKVRFDGHERVAARRPPARTGQARATGAWTNSTG